MTTPANDPIPRSPSGFVTARAAEALRKIEETGAAVANALPVQLFYPAEGAEDEVVAHFRYAPEEPWSVFGDITRGSSGLVVSRLEITPGSSSGVTAGLLRKIPIGEILAAVRAKAAWESARRDGTQAILGQEAVPGLFNEGDEQPPRRGGRTPITPDLLREVARAYLRETAPGAPAGGMKRMAEQFERPEETVRTWVTRARKAGWLGPSAKGRAGAEPGPKLLSWIGQEMRSADMIRKEAIRIGMALGATTSGVVRDAMRAYDQHSEPVAVHEMRLKYGLPPLETCVAAQVQYGRSLAEELAERTGAGVDEETALQEIGQELRQALDNAAAPE